MHQSHLNKLFGKNNYAGDLLAELLPAIDSQACLQDAYGVTLLGKASAHPPGKYPILHNDQTIGWVCGGDNCADIARLVEYLVNQEAEKRSLAAEVLNRYRELNMFYRLAENLTTSINADTILAAALQESSRLIKSAGGMILLVDENPSDLVPAALYGAPFKLDLESGAIAALIERTLTKGEGEIVNNLPPNQSTLDGGEGGIASILCAPLKTEKRILGLIVLVAGGADQFAAGDLKLLNTVASQAAQFAEIARLYQSEIENARMERELQMARQVQIDLLPKNLPAIPGWSFAARWLPAFEVAGDFYDFILRDNAEFDLVIGDVSDKGMHAALYMAFTRAALRAALLSDILPGDALRRTNRLLSLESTQAMFTTLFLARIHPVTGKMGYANAGHNPPIYYDREREQIHNLKRTGMALGILRDAPYEQHQLQLNQGDFVLLYTDGVTEAFDPSGNQFGSKRLNRILLEKRDATAEEIVAALESAVKRFIGAAHPTDDISIMAVKRS